LTADSWVDHSALSVFNESLQSLDSTSLSVRAQVFQFNILWQAGTHSDFVRYEVSVVTSTQSHTHAHSSCGLRHVKPRTLRRDILLTPSDQKVNPPDKGTQT